MDSSDKSTHTIPIPKNGTVQKGRGGDLGGTQVQLVTHQVGTLELTGHMIFGPTPTSLDPGMWTGVPLGGPQGPKITPFDCTIFGVNMTFLGYGTHGLK